MDPTVIVAILLILFGALLVVGLLAVISVFVFWRIRAGRAAKAEAIASSAAPASVPPPASAPPEAAKPPPPPKKEASAPPAPPPPPKKAVPEGEEPTTRMPALKAPPTQGSPGGAQQPRALGFFDDDDYATNSNAEAARTELFQRGAQAFDWDDDDDDEGGATEVFSAHHMDELGSDFTIEDEPER